MTKNSGGKFNGRNKPAADDDYLVGPGRPPKQFQFKPGQSGNPKGAKRKPRSMAAELKLGLENALNEKVTLRQGAKEKIVTFAQAGIEHLVAQFAKGDRHARRDLILLAEKLGVDLTAGQGDPIQQALYDGLAPSDQALLDEYLERRGVERELGHDEVEVDSDSSVSKKTKPTR